MLLQPLSPRLSDPRVWIEHRPRDTFLSFKTMHIFYIYLTFFICTIQILFFNRFYINCGQKIFAGAAQNRNYLKTQTLILQTTEFIFCLISGWNWVSWPSINLFIYVFISLKLVNKIFNIEKPVIFFVRLYQRVYVGTSPRKCKGRGRHSNNKVVAQKLGYALKPRLLITTLHPCPSPRTEIKLHPPRPPLTN